jgi:hypothetical protein
VESLAGLEPDRKPLQRMWKDPTPEDIQRGATRIRECFAARQERGAPFFIGRNGTIETETLYFWLTVRIPSEGTMPYPPRIAAQIEQNAGIFPATAASIDAWCKAYTGALHDLTGLAAGWYKPVWHLEDSFLRKFAPQAFRTPLRSLEPYYHACQDRWTHHLKGRRVAVVSSFTATIEKQIRGGRLARVWGESEAEGLAAPDISWSFVRTGYSPVTALGYCGWPAGVVDWQGAVAYTVAKVLESGAEIALVGCGGIGMLIGSELRRHGVSVLVLGGAIQVLFGLKGKRWETHSVISKFWNDAWRWPAADEIPGGARFVEGGCYWGAT